MNAEVDALVALAARLRAAGYARTSAASILVVDAGEALLDAADELEALAARPAAPPVGEAERPATPSLWAVEFQPPGQPWYLNEISASKDEAERMLARSQERSRPYAFRLVEYVPAALAAPAPQPAKDDGSVMVRIDRVYVDAMRGDGLTGPFACVRLVGHEGEPRLELTTAPVPTPDTADWWREVAQGLGVEIAKMKALVSAPACVATTPQGDVCGLCGRPSADHRGPENAAAPAPVEPPPAKCVTGHVWSNQFGEDWTPEHGKPCDCGAKRWRGADAVEPPPASPRLRGGGIISHAEIEDARKAQE